MKASEYIKEHGDFEITEVEKKCILYKHEKVLDLEVQDVSDEDIRELQRRLNA